VGSCYLGNILSVLSRRLLPFGVDDALSAEGWVCGSLAWEVGMSGGGPPIPARPPIPVNTLEVWNPLSPVRLEEWREVALSMSRYCLPATVADLSPCGKPRAKEGFIWLSSLSLCCCCKYGFHRPWAAALAANPLVGRDLLSLIRANMLSSWLCCCCWKSRTELEMLDGARLGLLASTPAAWPLTAADQWGCAAATADFVWEDLGGDLDRERRFLVERCDVEEEGRLVVVGWRE